MTPLPQSALVFTFWAVFLCLSTPVHDRDMAGWRGDRSPEAIPVARVLGSAYLGFIVGLILTYINGPDGQKIYFLALLAAQIVTIT